MLHEAIHWVFSGDVLKFFTLGYDAAVSSHSRQYWIVIKFFESWFQESEIIYCLAIIRHTSEKQALFAWLLVLSIRIFLVPGIKYFSKTVFITRSSYNYKSNSFTIKRHTWPFISCEDLREIGALLWGFLRNWTFLQIPQLKCITPFYKKEHKFIETSNSPNCHWNVASMFPWHLVRDLESNAEVQMTFHSPSLMVTTDSQHFSTSSPSGQQNQ